MGQISRNSLETTEVAVKILKAAFDNFARNVKNRPRWTKSIIQTAREMLRTIKYTTPVLCDFKKGIIFLDPVYITKLDGLPVAASSAPLSFHLHYCLVDQGQVLITDPIDFEILPRHIPTHSLNIMNDRTSEQPILLGSELLVLVEPKLTTVTCSDDENEPASKKIKLNKLYF